MMPGDNWFVLAQMMIKLMIAGLCGGILGIPLRGDKGAFYALVVITLGAALVTIISVGSTARMLVQLEQVRATSLIIAIGVLGAGGFISRKNHPDALQIGTGIWIAGAVGLGIGAGYFFPAIFITFVSYLLLERIYQPKRDTDQTKET